MNAVIYARYSSDNQTENSIEGQLRECMEYADYHGLSIVGEYIDRAFSAKTDNRPEFQRMLRDSSKRQFEVVLVWKLDRFSRNRTDSAVNKAILKNNGVRVVSAKENISVGSDGIILEAVLEGMAEYYSAELAEKVKRGMTENALKGKYNGGQLAYGYRIDNDGYYQIDPDTAPVVLEIFTRYADGENGTAIIDDINARGIRKGRRGALFTKNGLHTMLKNRKYVGQFSNMGINMDSAVPAIVPKDIFERVQKRMERNKKAPAAAKGAVDFLLTTRLFCGNCGAFMVGESGRGRNGIHYYYKCSNAKRHKKNCHKKAVKKDWIERLMVEKVKQLVLNETVIDDLVDSLVEYQRQDNSMLPILRKQLIDVEKRIINMLDAVEQGIVNDLTKQRLDELSERKADIELSIAKEKIANTPLTREQMLHFFNRFQRGDVNDPEYRRNVIDTFVNAFYLYDGYGKLLINTKDGIKTVTMDVLNGSDLAEVAPPQYIRESAEYQLFLRSLLLSYYIWGCICTPLHPIFCVAVLDGEQRKCPPAISRWAPFCTPFAPLFWNDY